MTATFAIAELKQGEKGGLCLRGAAKELWKSRDFETIICGPAETGKTVGCLNLADALLWKYSGAQGVLFRKVLADLRASALRTYLRIIGPESPIKPYGGQRPEWFDYPNGSRLWLCGLDNPGKTLSTERDFFCGNQVEELSLEDWEMVTSRATGRGSVMPYTRVFGDCNPGPEKHWIRARAGAGKLRLLESRHEDNPTLFDDDGRMTEQGKRTMAVLEALTGVRRSRLYLGLWASAEGAVYEDVWDRAVHIIDRFEIPHEWPRYWSIDFGFSNPFSWGAFAQDPDGRLIRYREIYHTRRLVEDHARQILEVTGWQLDRGQLTPTREGADPLPQAIIADHDAEGRATFERHVGMVTTPAYKSVFEGIEAQAARLRKADDGKPRLLYMRDSLVERDEALAAAHKPTCTEDEYESYMWPKNAEGKSIKEQPVKENDHSMDRDRYLVAFVDRLWDDPSTREHHVEYYSPVFISSV